MQYSFDIQEAVDYGVDEAIMIWNLRFWILKNKANNKHQYHGQDGVLRTWTYNTSEAFAKIFPFWKPLKIWRMLDSMEKRKIITKGNFNQNKHDRTAWYAFYDENQMLSSHLIIAHFSNLKNGDFKNEKSTFQNREMQISDLENGDLENEKSNTDFKPNIKTDIKPNTNIEIIKRPNYNKIEKDESELSFDTFWDNWKSTSNKDGTDHGKGSKKLAKVEFDKLLKKGNEPIHIIWGANAYLEKKKINNQASAHPRTFLSQELFEEFIEDEIMKFKKEQGKAQAKAVQEEEFKVFDQDPFWLSAKLELLNSNEISKGMRDSLEKFSYLGQEGDCHIINASSKFTRDWFTREYRSLFTRVFKKWCLISRDDPGYPRFVNS